MIRPMARPGAGARPSPAAQRSAAATAYRAALRNDRARARTAAAAGEAGIIRGLGIRGSAPQAFHEAAGAIPEPPPPERIVIGNSGGRTKVGGAAARGTTAGRKRHGAVKATSLSFFRIMTMAKSLPLALPAHSTVPSMEMLEWMARLAVSSGRRAEKRAVKALLVTAI